MLDILFRLLAYFGSESAEKLEQSDISVLADILLYYTLRGKSVSPDKIHQLYSLCDKLQYVDSTLMLRLDIIAKKSA